MTTVHIGNSDLNDAKNVQKTKNIEKLQKKQKRRPLSSMWFIFNQPCTLTTTNTSHSNLGLFVLSKSINHRTTIHRLMNDRLFRQLHKQYGR